jgi:hypothetical protein
MSRGVVEILRYEVARAGEDCGRRLHPRGNSVMAPGLERDHTPGETMICRLKLVAAPAGSQSEPDSGATAGNSQGRYSPACPYP